MIKNRLFTFFLLMSAGSLWAQNQNCDNTRFFDNVFTQTTVTSDVVYGQNTTFGGVTIDLLADVYEPANDNATNRPLIVFLHGGSFISGDKADMQPICEYYAQKGFVTASIRYRLYDGAFFPLPDSNDLAEVVVQSMGDLKAAIRWFKNDAINGNQYNIDTNYVFIGGVSAGAITALHTAYLNPSDNPSNFLMQHITAQGGWEGNSNSITNVSSAIRGVFNFSGALYRANYVEANQVPVYSVHDEFDGVVPYGNDFVSLLGNPLLYVEGSSSVHAQAQNVGVETELETIEGSMAHVSYFNAIAPSQGEGIMDRSAAFMVNKVVCPGMVNVAEVVAENTLSVFPNPAQHVVTLNVNQAEQVVITNVNGMQIWAGTPSADQFTIDVHNWPNGLYMITSFNATGAIAGMQKLVVN